MHSSQSNRQDLLNRLRRIEGQVRGLQRMVEDDRYCLDILTQLAAVQAALKRVGWSLLEQHSRRCVADALQHGDQEKVDELLAVIKRFVG